MKYNALVALNKYTCDILHQHKSTGTSTFAMKTEHMQMYDQKD